MKILHRSFAGGEVTPELYGRIELTKYQTGLALARNMIVLPHGPVTRRPGLMFVNEAKDSTQSVVLIPYAFSAADTGIIELGHQYARFHSNGATVLEASKAIVSIVGNTVTVTAHGYATGNWVLIGARFLKITVTGVDTFTTTDFWNVAATPSGSTAARVSELATPWSAADLYDLHYAQSGNIITVTHPGYATRELTSLGGLWAISTVSFSPTLSPPGQPTVTVTNPTAGNPSPQEYVITAVASDGVTESLASARTSVSNDLSIAGNYNTITWPSVSGAARYNLYKRRGQFGYIGQAAVLTGKTISSITRVTTTATLTTATDHNLSTGDMVKVTGATPAQYNGDFIVTVTSSTQFTYTMGSDPGASASPVGSYTAVNKVVDDNILPDTSQTPPEDIITLNGSANEYPAAVTYHEQRRWFGGTNNDPQTLWATRTAAVYNLTSSIPSRDADAMELRVASLQNNRIQHLVPLSDLIAFTPGGEWRIYADGAPAITPTSVSIKPQGYSGASNVQPVVTPGSILYVQAQGSRIREIAYNWESNAYRSIDISIMAPHRFNGYTIKQVTFSRSPEPIMWAVRSDGVLLGLTYVPEQQVYGWHAHDTDGIVESVAVAAESSEDALYVVVRRTINGRTVRYIERLKSRIFVEQADAFCVDSGLTYDGSPVSSISGLYHLEGETVQILADGAVHPTKVVTAGAITLDYAASVIHIGLAYTSDMRTLPLAIEGAGAGGQGTMKNVNKVHLRVTQSSLVKAGPSFTKLREYPPRAVTDPYGSAPALRTGEISLSIDPSWNTDASVCVRQDEPVPLTVLSMTLETAVGG